MSTTHLKPIRYDVTNVAKRRRQERYLSLNRKTGLITISPEAAELIGLKCGSQVVFNQHPTEPENWYIERVLSGGFEVRPRYKDKEMTPYLLNSTGLVEDIYKSLQYPDDSCKIGIGADEDEFGFALLTALIKPMRRPVFANGFN